MISQDLQIEYLRQQNKSYGEIGRLLGSSTLEIFHKYKFRVLPFDKAFNAIVNELKLYGMVVYRKDCQELLYRVLSNIKPKTKFRSVELLAPVIVFAVFRSKNVLIKATEVCKVCNLSLSDFKEGLLIVNPICTEYVKRDRKKLVFHLIEKILSDFKMDANFKEKAAKLYELYFPLFKNTKDNIVAGLIVTLSFVAFDRDTRDLHDIFKALGTGITRAHYHINRRIFLPNQLGDFRGFAKSKETLKKHLLAQGF